MALTEVTFGSNTYTVDRGNIGVVSDSLDLEMGMTSSLTLSVPTIGDVRVNTAYGPQNSLTGTLNPSGGGGGSGYSKGRIVNA
jgi:hypothetical protein